MLVDLVELIKGLLRDVGKTLQSNRHEAAGTFLHMGDEWAVAGAYEAYAGRWRRPVAADFLRWLRVPLTVVAVVDRPPWLCRPRRRRGRRGTAPVYLPRIPLTAPPLSTALRIFGG
jgi:hypothetical protein